MASNLPAPRAKFKMKFFVGESPRLLPIFLQTFPFYKFDFAAGKPRKFNAALASKIQALNRDLVLTYSTYQKVD